MAESKPSAIIVHSDGNIFFTNEAKFLAAAVRAMQEQQAGVPWWKDPRNFEIAGAMIEAERRGLAPAGVAADERTSAPAPISGAEKGEQVERQLNALTDAVIQQAAQPEAPRFQWVCENGCGPCNVKRIEFEYERVEDIAGGLLASKTIPRLVSKCCGADLSMWDNLRDEQIDVATEALPLPAGAPAAPSNPEAQQAAEPVAADARLQNIVHRLEYAIECFPHTSVRVGLSAALADARALAASPTTPAPATQLPQEWLTNLKDAARYLLQNGQTKQGLAVQACITMLEDDSE